MFRFLFVCLSMLGFVCAQSTTGALVGTVSDATGAVVAGVRIRVTNTATEAFVDTVTNASGDYTLPNLQPPPTQFERSSAVFELLS